MSEQQESIAIIGMAGRFPKAPDIASYWRNLRDGVDSITHFSAEELVQAGVPSSVVKNPRTCARGALSLTRMALTRRCLAWCT